MKRTGITVLAVALLAAAVTGGAQAADADLVAEGKAFAEKNCANCHAIGKEGKSRLPIAPPFRTFKEKWPLEQLEESLAEGIVTAHPAMPVFQLEPPQIAALIEYLHSLSE